MSWSKKIRFFIIPVMILVTADAWGAGATASITTPSSRPYLATGNFYVEAIFRIGDDRTYCPCSDTWFSCYAQWHIWLDKDQPNGRRLAWGEYDILNGSGIDPATTSESARVSISISGLDPTITHTVTAYLQDEYYVQYQGCKIGNIYAQDTLIFRICLDTDGDKFATCDGDCNDNDASIYPGAPELCDKKDNDCDGEVDEGCNPCANDPCCENPDPCKCGFGGPPVSGGPPANAGY